MNLELRGVNAMHTLLFKSAGNSQEELNELLRVFLESSIGYELKEEVFVDGKGR